MRAANAVWAALLAIIAAASAHAEICWPAVFEDGKRLHERGEMRISRLDLLFRQHELCWRRADRDAELRVVLTGNSGVYGYPLGTEESVPELLNEHFASGETPVHFFNAGHVYTDQIKDSLIVREALSYDVDLLIHSVVLEDMRHVTPLGYAPLRHFFDGNADAIERFIAEQPPTLVEPLERYRDAQAQEAGLARRLAAYRQAGLMARLLVQNRARELRDAWLAPPATIAPDSFLIEQLPQLERQRDYDCRKTHREFDERFSGWKAWNLFAYLEQVHRERGVAVAVLNWPIAREPRGDCYNVRFPARAVDDYNRWLAAEAARRGFAYLDYHDLLRADEFYDSLHATEAGQRHIAEQAARDLEPILRELYREKKETK